MRKRIYRALLLTVVVLALGVSSAEGQTSLTVSHARAVFLRAEPNGRFHGCTRRSAMALVCRVEVREVAVNEWQDPATGEWEVTGRAVYFVRARVPVYAGGVAWGEAESPSPAQRPRGPAI